MGFEHGNCITDCETEMYRCHSLAPKAAEECREEAINSFEPKPPAAASTKGTNGTNATNTTNSTNGTNTTALLAVFAPVTSNFAGMAAKKGIDDINREHYGCENICEDTHGNCIISCETEMYRC